MHRPSSFASAFRFLPAVLLAGLAVGQNLVVDINATAPSANSNPSALTAAGGLVYFAADDGVHGREVWYTNGTTAYVLDLKPGPQGSNPTGFQPFGGGVIVFADDGVHGIEMFWVSAAGVLLLEINPGPVGTPFGFGTVLGGQYFITAWTPANGYELWVTDLSSVRLVRDIVPGPADGVASYAGLAAVGTNVFFNGTDPAHGMELWRTDGTAAGTALVKDIAPGAANGMSTGNTIFSHGGLAYFMAYEPSTGNELWRSDGSEAGTTIVQDLVPGAGSSMPQPRAIHGALLYLSAQTPATGTEVFAMNGGNISLVKDCTPGAASSSLSAFTPAGDLLFFSVTNTASGTAQIWRSDDTTAGTFPVTGVPTLPATASPGVLVAVGRGTRVLFDGVEAGITGTEPWRSDGTIAGTIRLMDLAPGAVSSNPLGFTVVRDKVVFAATQPGVGRELFSMPLSLTRACVVETLMPGCPTGRYPQLDGYGIPRFGNASFALHLTGAAPNVTAGFLLSFSGNPGVGGCNLQVGPTAASTMVVTSANGFASMPLGIPNNPTFLSFELFAQAAVLQAGGPYLGMATLSNGLRIVIGDY